MIVRVSNLLFTLIVTEVWAIPDKCVPVTSQIHLLPGAFPRCCVSAQLPASREPHSVLRVSAALLPHGLAVQWP